MIHFYPRYANDVSGTPFAEALRELGIAHRLFPRHVNLRYRSKAGLVFGVYPRLAWFALGNAVRSLLLARPLPDVAVIGTDVEAVIFGLFKKIFRLKTRLVFETLIITPRASRVINALYQGYFAAIVALIDVGVCHAVHEAAALRAAYPRARCRFVAVPFGTTIEGRAALIRAAANATGARAVVTAGRSGRDYATLVAAMRGLDVQMDIICDIAGPLAGIELPPNVSVLTGCFDGDYLATLARARFVVVPLAVDDISAGQMVYLQSAALGRAVIMTRTSTSGEYAADGVDALLVERGDVAGMRAAIARLLADETLCAQLGAQASARFDLDHSTTAYVRNLVAAAGVNTMERAS